jgi:DNA-directed RNA polymerase subunit RPC12/RpoP
MSDELSLYTHLPAMYCPSCGEMECVDAVEWPESKACWNNVDGSTTLVDLPALNECECRNCSAKWLMLEDGV